MTQDYRPPRLTVEITEEQALFLRNALPHGLKKALFGIIIESLIAAIKEHGVRVIALVLEKKIDIATLMGISEDDDGNS